VLQAARQRRGGPGIHGTTLALLEEMENRADIRAAKKALKDGKFVPLEQVKKRPGDEMTWMSIRCLSSGRRISPCATSEAVQRRIVAAMEGLAADPRPPGCVKLQGEDELWRIRLGDYRVVYAVRDEKLMVLVVRVAHRKDVYRG